MLLPSTSNREVTGFKGKIQSWCSTNSPCTGRENSSATWLARNISRQPPSTCVLRWNIPTFDCWKIAIRNWASIRRCCYKCVEGIMGHWGYCANFVFWNNKFQHRQAGRSMSVLIDQGLAPIFYFFLVVTTCKLWLEQCLWAAWPSSGPKVLIFKWF